MRALLLCGAAVVALATTAQASILVGFEAPTLRNTTASFDFVMVETFDTRPTGGGQTFSDSMTNSGVSVNYTYTNVDIVAAGQFGGDNGTRYAETFGGPGSTAGYQLTFSATDVNGARPITYFGYWLSALDQQNRLQIFSNGTKIFEFNPADVIAQTGACSSGTTNQYCGNPLDSANVADRRNNREPYVFVNFFDTSGKGFDELRFFQSPLGGGYESDNHTFGFFTDGGDGTVIPGPAALGLFGLGLLGLVALRRR